MPAIKEQRFFLNSWGAAATIGVLVCLGVAAWAMLDHKPSVLPVAFVCAGVFILIQMVSLRWLRR